MKYEDEDNWYLLNNKFERWVRLYNPKALNNLLTKFVYLNAKTTESTQCKHSSENGLITYRGCIQLCNRQSYQKSTNTNVSLPVSDKELTPRVHAGTARTAGSCSARVRCEIS